MEVCVIICSATLDSLNSVANGSRHGEPNDAFIAGANGARTIEIKPE